METCCDMLSELNAKETLQLPYKRSLCAWVHVTEADSFPAPQKVANSMCIRDSGIQFPPTFRADGLWLEPISFCSSAYSQSLAECVAHRNYL